MILAAEEGKKIIPLEVDEKVGTPVIPEDLMINDKQITFDQFSQVKIKVLSKRVVYEEKKLICGKKEVVVNAKDGSLVG